MQTTTELLDILKTKERYEEVAEDPQILFLNITLAEYLNELTHFKKLKKSDIILKSGLERSYAYQIFAGKKIPSRDKLLALAFGMELAFEEVQRLLKTNSYAQLYPKNKRDSMIIFALYKKQSLLELNENLLRMDEPVIS